ncbi:MAG: EamA family transporter, partial [Acidimicrobiia bacterium]|nr:EamA family transporter [Acidimicrobiia bacterium]
MTLRPDPVSSDRADADNLKGAAWMTLGMAGYVANDSLIKLTAEDFPLFQAIFIRGVMVTVLLGGWILGRGMAPALPGAFTRPVLLRVATEALATAAYLTALTKLPLAGLTAVLQIVPVAVTFVAARVLKEPVSAHRVTAVVAGFGGVLLIVRPWSDEFSLWYLLGFVAMALLVFRELATLRVPARVPSLVVALATAVAIG